MIQFLTPTIDESYYPIPSSDSFFSVPAPRGPLRLLRTHVFKPVLYYLVEYLLNMLGQLRAPRLITFVTPVHMQEAVHRIQIHIRIVRRTLLQDVSALMSRMVIVEYTTTAGRLL